MLKQHVKTNIKDATVKAGGDSTPIRTAKSLAGGSGSALIRSLRPGGISRRALRFRVFALLLARINRS
jgi:hypothetical protein